MSWDSIWRKMLKLDLFRDALNYYDVVVNT